jgi:hypothetical protein
MKRPVHIGMLFVYSTGTVEAFRIIAGCIKGVSKYCS